MNPKVTMFTDGSCPKPHGPSGWGLIIRLSNGTEIRKSGGIVSSTNNIAEMMGVIEGLKFIKKSGVVCEVEIVSDSQYVTRGINEWLKNWKKRGWKRYDYKTKEYAEIANKELWKELDVLLEGHKVKATWVKGHNLHPENEACDAMACAETKKIKEMEKHGTALP